MEICGNKAVGDMSTFQDFVKNPLSEERWNACSFYLILCLVEIFQQLKMKTTI